MGALEGGEGGNTNRIWAPGGLATALAEEERETAEREGASESDCRHKLLGLEGIYWKELRFELTMMNDDVVDY
jgi:hypothetical protein